MRIVSFKDGGIRTVTYKLEHKGKIYTVIQFYRLSNGELYAEDITDENKKEVRDEDILDNIKISIKEYLCGKLGQKGIRGVA
jgi:hypothetical protein